MRRCPICSRHNGLRFLTLTCTRLFACGQDDGLRLSKPITNDNKMRSSKPGLVKSKQRRMISLNIGDFDGGPLASQDFLHQDRQAMLHGRVCLDNRHAIHLTCPHRWHSQRSDTSRSRLRAEHPAMKGFLEISMSLKMHEPQLSLASLTNRGTFATRTRHNHIRSSSNSIPL